MMKKIFYFLTLSLAFAACDAFFAIDETTHTLIVRNDSDIDIELQWRIGSLENRASLDGNRTRIEFSSMEFLTQGGNQSALDVNDIYDQFDELILSIATSDGLNQEIDLQTLQIDPFTAADGFMSTQEWFYTIDITNEHVN